MYIGGRESGYVYGGKSVRVCIWREECQGMYIGGRASGYVYGGKMSGYVYGGKSVRACL